MKKRILSLILAFALICSCIAIGTIGFTASAETVTKGVIDYTAENPLDGITAVKAEFALDTDAIKCNRTVGFTNEFSNKANAAVSSAQLQSYVVIPLAFEGELAADSSVYASFMTTTSNSSNYEAFGVVMADDTMYLSTNGYYKTYLDYSNINLTGRTVYKVQETADTSASITLTTANFSSSAKDSERVVAFVMAMAAYQPAKNGSYRYIENIYYTVEQSESSEPVITMDSGAAMRLDNKTDGIRFSATVPTADLVALKNSGANITDFGMLVAPADSNLTTDTMTVANSVESTAENIASNPTVVAAKYGRVTPTADEKTGLTVIIGSLVKISTENANKGYVARAYIEYEKADGNKAYIYSAISESRSIAEVAHNIATAGDGYYDSLCQNHKDVVDNWAKYAV